MLENRLIINKITRTMKYTLIDKVISIESGKEITAVKNVSLAEEYLGDHFPAFPVVPGVFLLQGMVDSASWLVRESQNFANSMITLEMARNVRYKSFAAPGMQVQYHLVAKSIDENTSVFKGVGTCGDEAIVEAKINLKHFNLADTNKLLASADAEIIENMKKRWKLLTQ